MGGVVLGFVLHCAVEPSPRGNGLSNVGGGGNNANQTKNIVGDVNVEYKLSKDGRYKLKGFNRTNDNTQRINNGGQYTQGLGFFFREEFDTWDELYLRYVEKIRRLRKNSSKKTTSDKKPDEKS